MLHVIATNHVLACNHSKFLEIAEELVRLTRQEDGCIAYSLTKSNDNPDILVYVETWQSKSHFEAHTSSEHFTRIIPNLRALRHKDTDVVFLEDAVIL
ncbi:MAG: antibiotic biosynthesis monooxygenase family protein [Clostridia bacterium]